MSRYPNAINFYNEPKSPKATAKQQLFKIGVAALKACNVPAQISFLGFSYNVHNKLREEINRLTENQAQKALEEIKNELKES